MTAKTMPCTFNADNTHVVIINVSNGSTLTGSTSVASRYWCGFAITKDNQIVIPPEVPSPPSYYIAATATFNVTDYEYIIMQDKSGSANSTVTYSLS